MLKRPLENGRIGKKHLGRDVKKALGLFVLAVLLSGCVEDQYKQHATCKIDVPAVTPTVYDPSSAAVRAEQMRACMEGAGYVLNTALKACPAGLPFPLELAGCFEPANAFWRTAQRIELALFWK